MEEGGDTKRKMELFLQALADLQALQDVLFELQNVQDEFPPCENRRKRATWHINENWRLAEASHCPALAIKQGPKISSTALRHPGTAWRWAVMAPGWRLAGAWRWQLLAPGSGSVGRFLLTFLLFSLLFRVTHLSGLLEQGFQSTKRTQK